MLKEQKARAKMIANLERKMIGEIGNRTDYNNLNESPEMQITLDNFRPNQTPDVLFNPRHVHNRAVSLGGQEPLRIDTGKVQAGRDAISSTDRSQERQGYPFGGSSFIEARNAKLR